MKINQEITADPVFLIDEEGVSQGTVSLDQALFLAYDKELDLAMVNENARPPITKLMDHGKYLYNQEKQADKQKAKSRTAELKEIRMGIKINSHDLEVKVNKIKKFLARGDKVRVSIQLRGREMMFQQKAYDLVGQIKADTGADYEKPIDRMGSRFFATLTRGKGNETKNS